MESVHTAQHGKDKQADSENVVNTGEPGHVTCRPTFLLSLNQVESHKAISIPSISTSSTPPMSGVGKSRQPPSSPLPSAPARRDHSRGRERNSKDSQTLHPSSSFARRPMTARPLYKEDAAVRFESSDGSSAEDSDDDVEDDEITSIRRQFLTKVQSVAAMGFQGGNLKSSKSGHSSLHNSCIKRSYRTKEGAQTSRAVPAHQESTATQQERSKSRKKKSARRRNYNNVTMEDFEALKAKRDRLAKRLKEKQIRLADLMVDIEESRANLKVLPHASKKTPAQPKRKKKIDVYISEHEFQTYDLVLPCTVGQFMDILNEANHPSTPHSLFQTESSVQENITKLHPSDEIGEILLRWNYEMFAGVDITYSFRYAPSDFAEKAKTRRKKAHKKKQKK